MTTTNVFAYARVSTPDQNLARQLEQLKEYVTDKRCLITDEASGKDFDRKGYNALVGTPDTMPLLHEGDLLVITSLDRLGRNYNEIREQWQKITNELKADIKVLDMPLLDTSVNYGDLDSRFVADLVLQILSYTAEKERQNIRSRQRQGIDAMPIQNGKRTSSKTGRPTGRPSAEYPDNWKDVYDIWKAGSITAVSAWNMLSLKKATFYNLVKRYAEAN